jgi:hypothetical protein
MILLECHESPALALGILHTVALLYIWMNEQSYNRESIGMWLAQLTRDIHIEPGFYFVEKVRYDHKEDSELSWKWNREYLKSWRMEWGQRKE